jgi:hypothetical protein
MKANEMTNEQLNEAIAIQRGWKPWDQLQGEDAAIEWRRDKTKRPPDYCNDWKYAGELLEEIKMDLLYCEGEWFVTNWCSSPTRAIAETYAIMEGIAE